jgi:hypothetical protein
VTADAAGVALVNEIRVQRTPLQQPCHAIDGRPDCTAAQPRSMPLPPGRAAMHEFILMNRGIFILFGVIAPALVLLLAVAHVLGEWRERGRKRDRDEGDGR